MLESTELTYSAELSAERNDSVIDPARLSQNARSSPLGLRLVVATDADVRALNILINSAYRGESSKRGWTTEAELIGGQRTDEQSLRDLISEPNQVILVQYNQGEPVGEPVGCVYLRHSGNRAYLGLLTVRPDLQGQGAGRLLLQQAETWAIGEWGVDRMEMTVIEQRPELIAWYQRRGYSLDGRGERFPYDNPKCGEPKVSDLRFVYLEKKL